MSISNPDEIHAEDFWKTTKTFPNQPPEQERRCFDRATRSAVFGILAGLANYLALPALTGLDRSGNQDEISALLTALAGIFIGSIQARKLCEKERERRSEVPSTVKASGAGLLGGAGIGVGLAALSALAVVPPMAVILVPALLGGAIAGGVTHAYSRRKTKYCPHCGCKGKCPQSVCRNCKKLFYPTKERLDCTQKPSLDWYSVASYFQEGFDLDYLDSIALTKKYIGEWIIPDVQQNNTRVDCSRFIEWVQDNKSVIANSKGEGASNQNNHEIKQFLDSIGL
jgi:hypothetical protein